MKILVRYGDLMLKGKNKKMFINKLVSHVKIKFTDLETSINNKHDQLILSFDDKLLNEVENRLMQIPGIHSYSIIYEVEKDVVTVVTKAVELLNETLDDKEYRFKIETKRADKEFKYTSLEFTKKVAPLILKNSNKKLDVDVKNPEVILHINIRQDTIYLYLTSKKALGGFPAKVAGKGL